MGWFLGASREVLLALPLLYSWIFNWGFANFLLGLGLTFLTAAWWLTQNKRPVRRVMLGLVLALAIYLCHALAFGLFGAVQRVSQGVGALLSPLASAATGNSATAAGIAAMGVVALIGVPLFAQWRLGAGSSPSPEAAETEAAADVTQAP